MTIEELELVCQKQENLKLSSVMLTLPLPKRGLRGFGVRTPFGICEPLSVIERPGQEPRVNVIIEVAKIRKWIARARKEQNGTQNQPR